MGVDGRVALTTSRSRLRAAGGNGGERCSRKSQNSICFADGAWRWTGAHPQTTTAAAPIGRAVAGRSWFAAGHSIRGRTAAGKSQVLREATRCWRTSRRQAARIHTTVFVLSYDRPGAIGSGNEVCQLIASICCRHVTSGRNRGAASAVACNCKSFASKVKAISKAWTVPGGYARPC